MLVGLLLFLTSRVSAQVVVAPSGNMPKQCQNIKIRTDCWGPAFDSPDNICLWNSGDGECNPESMDDIDKFCESLMQQSSCENRDCVWNRDDFKCQNDGGEDVNYEQLDNFQIDCTKKTELTCHGLAGRGQECRWVAATSSCGKGYFGNMDFHCGKYDASTCNLDASCIMLDGICKARTSHPQGSSTQNSGINPNAEEREYPDYYKEGVEPAEPEEIKEPPTLENSNPLLNNERNYNAGYWFLGVCGSVLLFGAVVKALFYKRSPTPSTEEALYTQPENEPEPILLSDGSALIV